MVRFWRELSSSLADCRLLPLLYGCVLTWLREREFLCCPHLRRGHATPMTSSKPKYFPEAPPQMPSHRELGFNIRVLGETWQRGILHHWEWCWQTTQRIGWVKADVEAGLRENQRREEGGGMGRSWPLLAHSICRHCASHCLSIASCNTHYCPVR